MDDLDRSNDLAGRIEGIAQALLRLTALLEMQGLIEGPHISSLWKEAVSERSANTVLRKSARKTLLHLASELDLARKSRQERSD